jgi:hypothetical protein
MNSCEVQQAPGWSILGEVQGRGELDGSEAVARSVVLPAMYASLFWVEWLDRLDRVLTGTREEVLALKRAFSPHSMAGIQRSIRQLTGLSNDLRLLDRNVLVAGEQAASPDVTDNLQKALDTAVFRLGNLTEVRAPLGAPISERILVAIDMALRDSLYEAALLLEPNRRRA